MNGQIPRPKTWQEWVKWLEEAINDSEMNLAFLKAQLEEAKKHVK